MKNKLNICLANDSFPPTIDGVANTVFNYADILTKHGNNVTVSTPYYPNVVDNYDFDVQRYRSVDATDFIGYRAGIPFSPKYISKLASKDIDIIHTHCPVMSTVVSRILSKTIDKPIIFTYHTKFDIEIRQAVESHLLQEAAIKILTENISACDEIWTVSKGAGENMKAMGYEGDYIVMPNGVDFEKGRSSQTLIDEIKETYNLSDDVPNYLFVGRMYWYKGLRIILDALRELKNHNQKFRMLFVGSGREADEIKDYSDNLGLQDEVTFVGPIYDRNYLKGICSSCDLFLFPSTYDTNGIVVREAAASGLASVLIKGSCAAEDTIDKRNSLWIEENSDSLAKTLLDIGNNKQFFKEIGENAMNELYLSWEDSVLNAYERYKYVIESYDPNKKRKITLKPNEHFMDLISDVSEIVTTSKAIRDRAGNVLSSVKDIGHISKYRLQEIKYYANTLLEENFDDYYEKISTQTKGIIKGTKQ